jgi:transposase
LADRVRQLEARLAELEDRLRADSSNSSKAPSSDPTWAPRLKPKRPTGRRPGGQRGHPGHHRRLLPAAEVDAVVDHRPAACRHCRAPLPADAPAELRGRHQVAELPPRAVVVTEHRSYACRCARCGTRTTEPIPAAVRASAAGPRLSAALCYLSAFVHGSRRAVEEVAGQMLGCALSLGTIVNREAEMAAALAGPYEHAQRHVRAAPAKHVDETGWRRAGRWLWVAATADAALFRIDRGRNWHALQNLLGERVRGTVCSDRHGLYEYLKVGRRAVCWAHLKRDFQRWVDRGGPTAWLGEEGGAVADELFEQWWRFRDGRLARGTLRRRLAPLRRRMADLLARGLGCGVRKAVYFCRNLRKVERAMWTFARVEGVEPTNNHAERMLRPAVIWRKTCFGSHGAGGCRYAERMLTVVQTLRLGGRPVLAFLAHALQAHRHALPAPALV